MFYLTDYVEIDGGYVAFRGNLKGGKITRKAEKRNRTLIEAARTMLADLKLPTMFQAKAVNTACYVQNKVLVVKPHNKTPYKLFHDRTPALSFMRLFGCPVIILNIKDHLGKFDVEENLCIRFSENTPNIARSEPNWHFDINALTKSMNYKPVIAGNQSNGNACTKACNDAESKSSLEDGFQPLSDDEKKVDEDSRYESECKDQENKDNVNNTNNVNVVGTNRVNAVGANTNNELPFHPEMPTLEDISTFNFSSDNEDDDEEADMNNLDTTIQMDVKSAFLYGKIDEEVYVCQPSGFEDHDFPDKVYKVEKALYGLHQTPRAWMMHEKFQISSMRELTFFLGLQVKQKQDGIFISQDKYVAEIIKKYGFLKVKNESTPMETQKLLLKDEDGKEIDVHMYRSMIGSLMYLTSLRTDIIFALKVNAARHKLTTDVDVNVVEVLDYYKGKTHQWGGTNTCQGKDFSGRVTPLFPTMMVQAQEEMGEDEAVNEEMYDSLERATTTATSLDAERQDTMGDVVAQTRSERVSKISNDPLLTGVNTHRSGENSLKLNELMELCTNLQQRVLDLETTKITQAQEITSLKKRVKRLEKKRRSRTHGLKRLYKVGLSSRVESSDDNKDMDDDQMFDDDKDLHVEEVIVEQEAIADKEPIVNTTQVSVAATTVTINDITLAKAFEALKTSKPKIKGIVIKDHKEPSELRTKTTTISLKKSQDRGKAIMIEELVKPKKKD
nr:hypothetical protein [Tanacetum cinerariifolium]